MSPKYALRITPSSYDLCVFLNDGVDLGQHTLENLSYLLVEINGPCEITTQVVPEEEITSAIYKDYLPLEA